MDVTGNAHPPALCSGGVSALRPWITGAPVVTASTAALDSPLTMQSDITLGT